MPLNVKGMYISEKKKSIQSAFTNIESDIEMQTFQEMLILFLKKPLIQDPRIIVISLFRNC